MKVSFSPVIKVWIFCLVFLPITCRLGFWQLDRAEEKETFLLEMERQKSAELSVWQPVVPVEDNAFRPFQLIGHYLGETFLLDNRIREGKVGYEVLTLFQLFTGEYLLVNRGWIKAGKYRHELPEITSPRELVTLEGHFYLPEGDVPVLKNVPLEDGWPKRVQQLQWNEVEEVLAGKVLASNTEFRIGKTDQPGAYKVGWPATNMMPEKHIGYAYQWFGLSIALVILTLIATIKMTTVSARKTEN